MKKFDDFLFASSEMRMSFDDEGDSNFMAHL